MMFVKLGIRNFWRQRRRNIFTLLSVIVGTAGLICLHGYTNRWEYRGLYNSVYAYKLGTVALYKKDGLKFGTTFPKKYTFSENEQQKILALLAGDSAIESVGKSLSMTGLASNGCDSHPFEIKGYEPNLDDKWREKAGVKKWSSDLVDLKGGKPFSNYPDQNTLGMALGLAQLLGKKTVLSNAKADPKKWLPTEYCEAPGAKERIAADPNIQLLGLTFSGRIGVIDTDIAHFYTTGFTMIDDTKLTAPLHSVQELYDTKNVSTLNVFYHEHTDAAKKARDLQNLLLSQQIEVDAYAWDDGQLNPMFVGPMNLLYVMNTFFGILIFGIVILSVVNLTMMNVAERSREMGTMKALGYKERVIAKIFLLESAIIAALGCIVGVLIAYGASAAINASGLMFLPPGSSESIPLWIIPSASASAFVSVLMFVLVTLSSWTTSVLVSRRSCLELLTHHSA